MIPQLTSRAEAWALLAVAVICGLGCWNAALLLRLRARERTARALRTSEQALRISEERLLELLDTLLEGVLLIDADGTIVYGNTAARKILAASASDLIGAPYDDPRWMFRDPSGAEILREEMPLPLVLRGRRPVSGLQYAITAGDGCERVVKLDAAPLEDGNGRVTGLVASLEDVTERRQLDHQLRHLSLHDALTGLYNRAFFEEEMQRAGRGRDPVAIIVCDVDGLKLVNDTLGHAEGDALLRRAGEVIRGCFRQDAVVARIGGDEFAVLFPGDSREVAQSACRRLEEAVEQLAGDGTHAFPLRISIGCAISEGLKFDMAQLFKSADDDMYRQKLRRRHSKDGDVVRTVVRAIATRDLGTEEHAWRTESLAAELGRALGFADARIADLRLFARFHDIGTVGIPERILLKSGPLTAEEELEVQRHAEAGRHIALASPELQRISDWILKHHEHWDGSGYPLHLSREEIPLECRILAVVDAFDAMTHARPYRPAKSVAAALQELQRCAGTQFDPNVVERFIAAYAARTSSAQERLAT